MNERSGFVLAHLNARYTGQVDGPGDPGDILVDARTLSAARLAAFDDAHVAAPRPRFLERWLAPADRIALAAVAGDGEVRGYGVLRPSVAGHRIGPLFAADPETAATLLRGLGGRARGQVSVDVPLTNAPAVALVEELGLRPSFQTARMYRGPDPGIPVERIYAITSLEVG